MWSAFVAAFGATLGVCAALTLAIGMWVWIAVAARKGHEAEGELKR